MSEPIKKATETLNKVYLLLAGGAIGFVAGFLTAWIIIGTALR